MSDDGPDLEDIGTDRHPDSAPTFWEGWEEWSDPREIFRNGWNDFRERSYHDLELLRDRLLERARAVSQKEPNVDGSLQERFDFWMQNREELGPLHNAWSFFTYRARAAGALMRYIEEKGDPKEWEDLDDKEKNLLEPPVDMYERRILALYKTEKESSVPKWIQEAVGPEDMMTTTDSIQRYLRRKLSNRYDFDRLDVDTLEILVQKEASRLGFTEEE